MASKEMQLTVGDKLGQQQWCWDAPTGWWCWARDTPTWWTTHSSEWEPDPSTS